MSIFILITHYRFHVHRSVMVSSSQYFFNLFSVKQRRVLINIDKQTLKLIIDYCYCIKIAITPGNIVKLISAATICGLTKLQHKCAMYSHSFLTSNAMDYVNSLIHYIEISHSTREDDISGIKILLTKLVDTVDQYFLQHDMMFTDTYEYCVKIVVDSFKNGILGHYVSEHYIFVLTDNIMHMRCIEYDIAKKIPKLPNSRSGLTKIILELQRQQLRVQSQLINADNILRWLKGVINE